MNRLINIYSALLAASPALAVYILKSTFNLDIVLLWLCIIILFFNSLYSEESVNKKYFLGIIAVTILSSLVNFFTSWFSVSLMVNNLYSIIVVAIPLVYFSKQLNINIFVKSALLVGIAASFIVIWQRISFMMTGSYIKEMYLPWFELSRDLDTIAIERPSAFFTEPAHLCIFILPLFCFTFHSKMYLLAALFAFSMLCSGSSTGFLGIAVLVSFSIFTQNSKRKYLWILLSIIITLMSFWAILRYFPELILENTAKLNRTDVDSEVRLLGPLKYYGQFGVINKMAGVTLNQLFLYLHSEKGMALDPSWNYANAAVNTLISYGIFGALITFMYIKNLWKKYYLNRLFLIAFLLVFASDQILYNSHFLYLMSWVLISNKLSEFKLAIKK